MDGMRRLLSAVLTACLACAWALAACVSAPPPAAPLDRITLQLKWKHQFQFAGYYAAQAQGYYRDAGLEVTLLEAPNDAEPAQAVLRGDAEFGIAASDLVLLRSQGFPVVALAAIYQHSPLVLLASRRAGTDSVHDLVGRRVMLEAHAEELLAYLESEGVSRDELILRPHTFDPAALIAGEVDAISAYSTDEPFLLTQAGLDFITLNPRAGGIDFYGDTLFTTEAEIREHPERVRAFVDASLRGWQYALDHPDEIADLIYGQYSQRHSREHLAFEAEQTRRLILPDVVEIGYMNPGRWRHIADVYADLGMVSANFPVEGLIYEGNPAPNYTWLYVSLSGAVAVLGLVSYLAIRLSRVNAASRRQIAEHARREGQLRAAAGRYRVLAENSPFPIVITRLPNGVVLYFNPKAAERLAVGPGFALGQASLDMYEDPADRAALTAAVEQEGFVQNFELRMLTANGAGFWASLSATAITFEEQPALFVALVDVTDRKELERRLESLAMSDELTGLSNRRSFTLRGAKEFRRAARYRSQFSILLLDIDYFKTVNDKYGHDAGDAVLRALAEVLQQNLRAVDVAGRLGGDEFGIILPDTGVEGAGMLAERLRARVERRIVKSPGSSEPVTVSVGATAFDGGMDSFDDALKRADDALYRAKNGGRNQVCVAEGV